MNWNFLAAWGRKDRATVGRLSAPSEPGVAAINALSEQLKNSAYYAAVRRLTSDCASMPVELRNSDNIRLRRGEILVSLPALKPFIRRANLSMSAHQYLMRCYLDLVTYQSHLAIKIIGSEGRLIGLEPLDIGAVRVSRNSGVLTFETNEKTYNQEQVFYVTAFGDGLVGFGPQRYGAQAIGLSKAVDDAAGGVYVNSLRPNGVLSIDGAHSAVMSDAQVKRMEENFQGIADGTNKKRIWLLEQYMKYEPIGFNAEDSQLIQTRRFQIEEVCRFVGVPPFLIFEHSVSTQLGSSLEEMLRAYYEGSVRHLTEALASAIESQLLSDADAAKYEVIFDLDTARLASQKTRLEANSVAINSGQMTPNEARAREGLQPVDGGDTLLVQGALINVLATRK